MKQNDKADREKRKTANSLGNLNTLLKKRKEKGRKGEARAGHLIFFARVGHLQGLHGRQGLVDDHPPQLSRSLCTYTNRPHWYLFSIRVPIAYVVLPAEGREVPYATLRSCTWHPVACQTRLADYDSTKKIYARSAGARSRRQGRKERKRTRMRVESVASMQ